jgi:hypothetical protein
MHDTHPSLMVRLVRFFFGTFWGGFCLAVLGGALWWAIIRLLFE